MTHDIDLVRFSLTVGDAELQLLQSILSEDEAARARRFLQQGHGDRFVAARGRLRQILGGYAGCEPAAVAFDSAAHGKPALRTAAGSREPVHFNLTHSGDVAAVALCRSAEVGIDIERIRPVREGLARRYFAAEEVAGLDALEVAQRLPAFFRCWTRKEAFLKATGEGIRRGLDSFVVTVGADEDPSIVSIDGDRAAGKAYVLADFDAGPGTAGAVCVHAGADRNRVAFKVRDFG
ncbi:MAG: 4'-phosphopantetheinyl transferase superfamily protein [Alphaproteobacteria bacterium]|nr:4'-phosphopantetheinyl transferase superfamily protein [Alphaproteobacteria bacterium]